MVLKYNDFIVRWQWSQAQLSSLSEKNTNLAIATKPKKKNHAP